MRILFFDWCWMLIFFNFENYFREQNSYDSKYEDEHFFIKASGVAYYLWASFSSISYSYSKEKFRSKLKVKLTYYYYYYYYYHTVKNISFLISDYFYDCFKAFNLYLL